MTNITSGSENQHQYEHKPNPSMGEIYAAHNTLEHLDALDNWAFGDKARRKDMKHAARTVLELAGSEKVEQVITETHEWLVGKEADLNY